MLVRAAHRLIAWALPPRCPGCGTPVAADHSFCAPCWSSLRFVAPPWCAGCQRPVRHDLGDGVRCSACLARPSAHDGVRAAVAYGDVARTLALKLKYGRRTGIAATMAEAMLRVLPADLDLLVPVPLHRSRLWVRGFNQAALIARALAVRSGVRVEVGALVRRRSTAALRGMDARERHRTVAGAFALAPGAMRLVEGRHVGLVDDVYTTGATAEACARTLRRGGAVRVTVLCWARVLREGDD